jgi:predicted lipid-binding transport protein (Tim44 family)
MHRAGWGVLVALLAGGAIGLAWLLARSGPGPLESHSPAASAVRSTFASDPSRATGSPGRQDGDPAAAPAVAPSLAARPSAAGPASAASARPDDDELGRVAEALAREPALIDAMQDAASHPDAAVRAEAEALVVEALERARARAASVPPAAP